MTMTEARAHSGKTAEMQAARVVRRERRQRPRCLSPALLHPPHVDPLGLQQRRHAVLTHQMPGPDRSEEHTSELQSLMRISYAVFCLKKKIPTSPLTHMTHQLRLPLHAPH